MAPVEHLHQVVTVTTFAQRLSQLFDLGTADPALFQGNFFRTGDFEALARFDGFNETGRLLQGLVGPGIEPCIATTQTLNQELVGLKVPFVQIGNFELATLRRRQAGGISRRIFVVEIQSGDRVVGTGMLWFFLDAQDPEIIIEFDDTISFRITNPVSKNRGTVLPARCIFQHITQSTAMKNIVAQDEATGMAVEERLGNDEGLSQAFRLLLDGIIQLKTPLAAIAQQIHEHGLLMRRRDHLDFPDPGLHQG